MCLIGEKDDIGVLVTIKLEQSNRLRMSSGRTGGLRLYDHGDCLA